MLFWMNSIIELKEKQHSDVKKNFKNILYKTKFFRSNYKPFEGSIQIWLFLIVESIIKLELVYQQVHLFLQKTRRLMETVII